MPSGNSKLGSSSSAAGGRRTLAAAAAPSGVLATDPSTTATPSGLNRTTGGLSTTRLPHDSRRGEHCPATPHNTTPAPKPTKTHHETCSYSSYTNSAASLEERRAVLKACDSTQRARGSPAPSRNKPGDSAATLRQAHKARRGSPGERRRGVKARRAPARGPWPSRSRASPASNSRSASGTGTTAAPSCPGHKAGMVARRKRSSRSNTCSSRPASRCRRPKLS